MRPAENRESRYHLWSCLALTGRVSDISVNTGIQESMPQDQYGRIPAIMAVFGDLIREFGRETGYSANFRGFSTIRRRFVATRIARRNRSCDTGENASALVVEVGG